MCDYTWTVSYISGRTNVSLKENIRLYNKLIGFFLQSFFLSFNSQEIVWKKNRELGAVEETN